MDPETVITTDVDDKVHQEEHTIDTITTGSISSRQRDADDDESQNNTLVEMPVEVLMDCKNKIVKASDDQKALMLEFFQENPELITHSSTWDNEKELWKTLTNKLNDLDPKRTVDAWKSMWYRWQHSVNKRSEEKLKCIDLKMKKWLNVVKTDPGTSGRLKPKKRINNECIDSVLKRIEKEKYNLHLEIDETEMNIMRFRTILRTLEYDNAERNKRMKKLNERKIYYNCKKRKIMEVEEDDIKKLELQLLAIDQKLAEEEP